MEIKLRPYTSFWARRLALYFGLYVVIISSHIYFSRFDIWHTDVDSARYMLSSLIQSEAAIVALVVTLSLVAVQLAASSYSTRVVDVFIKTPDLWILILIYGIAMFYGLIVLKLIEKADPQKCAEVYVCQSNLEPHIALSYFLGVFAFVALVPYIWNTVRLLKPAPLFDRLAEEITNKSILDTIHNEQIKTDKEGTLQPILDIVNGSIMKYDYGTAKYGLRAIGNKANDILKNRDIDKKEKKEISGHIFSNIVTVGQLAISKENERSSSEVIAILCANGITSVEQELEEVAFKAIKSIRLLGVDALNNKLEFLATDACSSLRKVGEKSVEKDLKILTKQGGWWEISSIKDIGMISAKYKLEYSIMEVAISIMFIGIAAVKHRLKGTIQMTIDSLEEVGMEAAKYKFIGGIRNVSASLGSMKDEMFGKEEFNNEEQKAINSHLKILKKLKELEQYDEKE